MHQFNCSVFHLDISHLIWSNNLSLTVWFPLEELKDKMFIFGNGLIHNQIKCICDKIGTWSCQKWTEQLHDKIWCQGFGYEERVWWNQQNIFKHKIILVVFFYHVWCMF